MPARYASALCSRHGLCSPENMLLTIAVVLLVFWLMGFFALHVTTAFIHLLLVAAAVTLVVQLVTTRRFVSARAAERSGWRI
jgi:hypothetical protein